MCARNRGFSDGKPLSAMRVKYGALKFLTENSPGESGRREGSSSQATAARGIIKRGLKRDIRFRSHKKGRREGGLESHNKRSRRRKNP